MQRKYGFPALGATKRMIFGSNAARLYPALSHEELVPPFGDAVGQPARPCPYVGESFHMMLPVSGVQRQGSAIDGIDPSRRRRQDAWRH